MKIAVLSGKGGTGKTLVSVNLVSVAKHSTYIDCDVEEPNGHLFFNPTVNEQINVTIKTPALDNSLCNGCRKCVDFCKFNALAFIKDRPIIFEDVCHSCGGCILFCPNNALSNKEKTIGKINKGMSNNVQVISGILNTGEVSGVPIIKNLLCDDNCPANQLTVIDCPPGSACIVMESIKDADYCILVAEPTLFGVHNFEMVYNLVKLFNKPFGAVLNKCLDDENPAEIFCLQNDINILAKIPFSTELGTLNSNAKIAVNESDEFKTIFNQLLENVAKEMCNNETATNS